YMWTNYYDDMTQLLNMDLDFFVKVQAEDDDEDNLYERYKEVHLQRAHKEEELAAILEEAVFKDIRMFGDFSLDDVDKKSERVFFLAKK
ncbi:MAG: class I SAM-dependent methyltransferase, partial [Peptostreptococcus sp.]|nr:class I SAM-dependent methyltransferase [Peptostreptococcus sp.]